MSLVITLARREAVPRGSGKGFVTEGPMKKMLTVLVVFGLGMGAGLLLHEKAPVAEAGEEPGCAPLLVTGGGVVLQDMNGDGSFNPITEAVSLLSWAFLGGPAPPLPCDPPELTARIEELEAQLESAQANLATCQTELADCRAGGSAGATYATEQTECYDASGRAISCNSEACPGQDGRYRTGGCGSAGRFVENGDGTVTDKCTGLMWQGRDEEENAWCDALAYCENLSLAGHDDFHEKALEVKGQLGGPRPL
jgi:hypothetical protein